MRHCGVRDASKENLAEGFLKNLAGRDVGLYYGKFQEPIPRRIYITF